MTYVAALGQFTTYSLPCHQATGIFQFPYNPWDHGGSYRGPVTDVIGPLTIFVDKTTLR